MAEVIPFDFEEHAVRVVKRGDDPWFVAADVCRVLEIGNPTDAVKRLDEDEVTLDTIEGSHRKTNLINESGLYALVLTSRKDSAKRFRKWITSEVLPAIRREGRYELTRPTPSADFEPGALRETELWLSMIREARLLGGAKAGRRIWHQSPLPPLAGAPADQDVSFEEAMACLDHLLDRIELAKLASSPSDMSACGLRMMHGSLFVANCHPQVLRHYAGSQWADGKHRLALMSLPGAAVPAHPLTMAGKRCRGVIVPATAMAEGLINA